MKFEEYDLRLNFKAISHFETILHKPFSKFSFDDAEILMYCCFIHSNQEQLTYKQFQSLLKNKKFSNWIWKKFGKISESLSEFEVSSDKTDEDKSNNNSNDEVMSITDLLSQMIIEFNLDPQYANYVMEIWEFNNYCKAMSETLKRRLDEQRMWTFLTVSPHIDTKKCKSPEKLLPFPWDEEKKTSNAENKLRKELASARNIFKINKKENDE